MPINKFIHKYFILPIFFYYMLSNVIIIGVVLYIFNTNSDAGFTARADSGFSNVNLNSSDYIITLHVDQDDFEQTYMFKSDPRAKYLDQYFASIDSPLKGTGYIFISESEKYNIDWRFLPSLAMQESSGAKSKTAKAYKNPFGWGFNDDKNNNIEGVYSMPSYEASIKKVAFWISNSYIEEGLETPEEIVTKYNPGSVQRADGDPSNSEWVKGIRFFYNKFESEVS